MSKKNKDKKNKRSILKEALNRTPDDLDFDAVTADDPESGEETNDSDDLDISDDSDNTNVNERKNVVDLKDPFDDESDEEDDYEESEEDEESDEDEESEEDEDESDDEDEDEDYDEDDYEESDSDEIEIEDNEEEFDEEDEADKETESAAADDSDDSDDSDAWRKTHGDYLLIDIGNSAAKFGLFARDRLYLYSMLSLPRESTDWTSQFGVWVAENEIQLNEVDIHLSSVCPAVMDRVVSLLGPQVNYKQWAADDIPIKTEVENRLYVGTDRLLAAVFPNSIRTKKYPLLICNCGTALTLDVVSPKGVFLGGQIVPGVETGLRALHDKTAYLPLVEKLELPDPAVTRSDLLPTDSRGKAPKLSRRQLEALESSPDETFADGLKWGLPQGAAWFIGRNSPQAMTFGAVNAACGIIERTARLLKKRYQRKPVVFLSGGAAEVIRPYLTTQVVCCDNLVLRGLWTALRAKNIEK